MDPRSRLWTDVIFPRCEPAALLVLRSACRGFRDQLNAAPARLWMPLIMANTRMRYEERVQGWRGVESARAREERTRANCEVGHFQPGFILNKSGLRDVRYLCGRVAAFYDNKIELHCADGSEAMSTFAVQLSPGNAVAQGCVVLDRWVAFATHGGCLQLLDCWAARLVELVPANALLRFVQFSVAGPCVSYRSLQGTDVRVMHISADGSRDGPTTVRRVGSTKLSCVEDMFALCERGKSYLIYYTQTERFILYDVAMSHQKREFDPPAGHSIRGGRISGDGNYIVAHERLSDGREYGNVVFRIRDGYCSGKLPPGVCVLCVGGRALPASLNVACHFVDALSGALVSRRAVLAPVVDTSGALLWSNDKQQLLSGSTPDGPGCVLPPSVSMGDVHTSFRFGVFMVHSFSQYRVLHFDVAPDAVKPGEPLHGGTRTGSQVARTAIRARETEWV